MQSWIDRFNQAELPALAAVVQDLHRLTLGHKSSVQQLADVLLRDAALTTKVLRIGNSVYYNPSQEPIRTISRAIVLIGFDNVRQIGLSVSLIDGLLARSSREQLAELLAQSFHAAVQARNIAGYVLSRSDEEVFIAALLHNVGELAFWGCAGETADELASALAQPGIDADDVVMDLLGTSFRQMSLALVKSWNLGDTVSLALQASSQHDPAVKAVTLGAKISQAALEGWDSATMESLVGQLASFIGVTPQEAMQQVLASADETVKMAATFGASQLCKLIPNTDPEQIRLQQEQRKARLLQPNLLTLQQALQDLGLMVSKRADLGLVLDTLFKGLHQGAGLERIMLVVLADGQSCFRCKRVIGEGTAGWAHDFILPVEQTAQPHIFSYALRNKEALWMGVPASYNLNELVTQPIRQRLGQGMFFIAPLLAGTREIGLLYADSRGSGRALKHEQFVAFQRFTQLTGRCLEAMSKRG
ncbi:HDOD domain-containing protein [Pseudomonas anguilliseptica]|uniref:HDOD domain-containing protein n=1 Tax=Pseudomonas anguilliseptica TaxID=53406 RepID=UPI001F1C62B0|nr:HDOD domain-containing protein [Pseudomonas anguilliseptica]MCE5363697.1 HDOD domain-containing protein [Pseudomonas anguilliseptica]